MQKKWQNLGYKVATGKEQMDLDEKLLLKRSRDEIPNTLRFYGWKPSCITYGFFQTIKEEIDEDLAKDFGLDIVQRITGGGCVLHRHELTYSIVVSEKDVPADILESYSLIIGCLIRGLAKFGVNAVHKPVNDIHVNGKKISGNAQTRRGGVMLMHGTILLDIDEDMFRVLKKGKRDKVTSLKELGVEYSLDDLMDAFSKEFENVFSKPL